MPHDQPQSPDGQSSPASIEMYGLHVPIPVGFRPGAHYSILVQDDGQAFHVVGPFDNPALLLRLATHGILTANQFVAGLVSRKSEDLSRLVVPAPAFTMPK